MKIHQSDTPTTNDPKKARIADMQNGRIIIYTSYGRNFWERGYCERKFDIENERGISTQWKTHGGITNLRRPYCAASFKNISNLKQHILKKVALIRNINNH